MWTAVDPYPDPGLIRYESNFRAPADVQRIPHPGIRMISYEWPTPEKAKAYLMMWGEPLVEGYNRYERILLPYPDQDKCVWWDNIKGRIVEVPGAYDKEAVVWQDDYW